MGTNNRYRRICERWYLSDKKSYNVVWIWVMKPANVRVPKVCFGDPVHSGTCRPGNHVLCMRKYWKQRKTCGRAPPLIHGIPQNSPRYSPRYFQWERTPHWVRSVVLWAKAGKLMRMRLLDPLMEPLNLDGRCRLSRVKRKILKI